MGSREEVCGEDVNFNGDVEWNKAMREMISKAKREGAVQAHKVLRHLMKCKEDKDIINKELKKLEEMGVER